MTKPYSEDLRTRVVAAVVVGASCRDGSAMIRYVREEVPVRSPPITTA
jgi:transposase